MLHVINGDHAAALISAAGLPGKVLPWRDVLHEGPMPGGLSLQMLSTVRADFIESMGWASGRDVHAEFAQRDAALEASRDEDEVVLWFEHDLYDQLQLIQLLQWYAEYAPRLPKRLSLVQADSYLGLMPVQVYPGLYRARQSVSSSQIAVARNAWAAVTAGDPTLLTETAARPLTELPYLAGALLRLLEEYPSTYNGLSRSEAQLLEALTAGPLAAGEAFKRAHADREERIFLGDTVFASHVNRLAQSEAGAIVIDRSPRFWESRLTLNALGAELIAGQCDWVETAGIERWVGGVHLGGRTVRWRWDCATRQLLDLHC